MVRANSRGSRWALRIATAALGLSVCRTVRAGEDARTLILRLEQDAGNRTVVAEAVTRAKEALERETRLRAVHDEAHADEAEALALEWANVGRDLVRAVGAEAAAADTRRKATDARAQLERSEALLEEGIARVGRLRADLAEAERTGHAPRIAIERHADDPPTAGDRPARASEGPSPSRSAGPAVRRRVDPGAGRRADSPAGLPARSPGQPPPERAPASPPKAAIPASSASSAAEAKP